MKSSEVLNRAADEIERRGWATGGGWFPKPGEGSPVCAEGGLKLAACTEAGYNLAAKRAAYDVLVAYLNDRYPECINSIRGSVIPFTWNDWPGRTQAEVVEALRAAAVIEQARETEIAAVAS